MSPSASRARSTAPRRRRPRSRRTTGRPKERAGAATPSVAGRRTGCGTRPWGRRDGTWGEALRAGPGVVAGVAVTVGSGYLGVLGAMVTSGVAPRYRRVGFGPGHSWAVRCGRVRSGRGATGSWAALHRGTNDRTGILPSLVQ